MTVGRETAAAEIQSRLLKGWFPMRDRQPGTIEREATK